MTIKYRATALITLSLAAVALVGCSPSTGTDNNNNSTTDGTTVTDGSGSGSTSKLRDYQPTEEELAALIKQGKLPETFPTDAKNIRVVEDGDRVAVAWAGEALSGSCSASTETPGSYALGLLIQDAALEEVQQCGDFWQAKQADGTWVSWNDSSSN